MTQPTTTNPPEASPVSLLQSPLFNVLAFSIFWAMQIFITKLAFLKGARLFPFTIQSALFSGGIMLIAVLPRCRRDLRSMKLPILLGVLCANAIHNGLGGFLANMGTARASATNAAFVMQCSTVTTTLMAWLILGEPLSREKIATVALIIFGSFLLLTDGLVAKPGVGELLLLFACISWSTGNVSIRWLLKKTFIKSDVVSLLRPIAGLPVFIALFGISHLWSHSTPTIEQHILDTTALGYAAWNGLLCALVWIFLNRTLEVASASYMTAMCSLTPVFVGALAIPFLGERLSIVQFFGGGLIVCSSLIVHRLKF